MPFRVRGSQFWKQNLLATEIRIAAFFISLSYRLQLATFEHKRHGSYISLVFSKSNLVDPLSETDIACSAGTSSRFDQTRKEQKKQIKKLLLPCYTALEVRFPVVGACGGGRIKCEHKEVLLDDRNGIPTSVKQLHKNAFKKDMRKILLHILNPIKSYRRFRI